MNRLTKTMCELEETAAALDAVLRSAEKIHERMEEGWCTDCRYYAFKAFMCHSCYLSGKVTDALEALSSVLFEHRREIVALYADSDNDQATRQ